MIFLFLFSKKNILLIIFNRKVTLRTEPISIPTNLIASTQIATASKKIKSHQLLSSLKKTSSLQVQTLNKQLAKVNKHQAVLQQPLQKPQAEKVFIYIFNFRK